MKMDLKQKLNIFKHSFNTWRENFGKITPQITLGQGKNQHKKIMLTS